MRNSTLIVALAFVGCGPNSATAPVVLTYSVEQDPSQKVALRTLIAAVERRIANSESIARARVSVSSTDGGEIEVAVKNATLADVAAVDRLVSIRGTLEVRIVANTRDHPSLIDKAIARFPDPVVEDGKPLCWWVPLLRVPDTNFLDESQAVVKTHDVKGALILVVNDDLNLTDKHVATAGWELDAAGRRVPSVRFNLQGARRFISLMRRNHPGANGFRRRLAIILDGHISAMPAIGAFDSEKVQLGDLFRPQEVDALVDVFNDQALPAVLRRKASNAPMRDQPAHGEREDF